MHIIRAGVAMVVLLSGVLGLAAGDVPVLHIRKCSKPPEIDGDLSDAAWKNAALIDDFYIMEQGRREKKHRAWVTFDDAWLYVAFGVQQSDTERLEPKHVAGHDDKVQRDDCVKLSFVPGGPDKTWYHFKLNRANIRQDRRWPEGGQQEIESWNIPWKSAVKSREQNWTVEMAVPLCLLPPVNDISKARINLVITSFIPFRDPQGVAVGSSSRTDYSLAEVDKWWVGPEDFAVVKGMDKVSVQDCFLPWVESASIAPYFEKDGKYFYGMDLKIRNCTGKNGALKLEVTDRPAAAEPRITDENVELSGQQETVEHKASVPVDSMVERTAVLRVLDPETGYEWRRFSFSGDAMSSLDLFGGYLGRNYYTTEEQAEAVLHVRLPESVRATLAVVARNTSGMELARVDGPAVESRLSIPLKDIPVGRNPVTVNLLDSKGKAMSSLKMSIVKREPNPGCEWKIDRVNRVVLDNGKPFFAMGFCSHRIRPTDGDVLKKLKGAGFNFVQVWNKFDDDTLKEYAKLFEENGLHMMPALDDGVAGFKLKSEGPYKFKHTMASWCSPSSVTQVKCWMVGPGFAKVPRVQRNEVFQEYIDYLMPEMVECMQVAKKSPATCGYWIFDEPFPQFFDQGLIGRKFYEKIHETDGYHPVLVNFSSEIPDDDQATIFMDILATDPYWIVAEPEMSRGTINWVSMITARTVARGEPRRLAAWILPMSPRWSATVKRYITYQEQMCQTYLGAIHGATGIMYFTLDGTRGMGRSWDAVVDLAGRFRDVLGPACVSPAVDHSVEYFRKSARGKVSHVDCVPVDGKLPDIQVALKRDPKGGGYILMAANSRYYPVACEITVKGIKDGEIDRHFSDDKYPVKDGKFTDKYEKYGVRAYRIPAIKEPVEIEVTSIPPGKLPPRERAVPWRGDRKNKFPNPSFELSSDGGCLPDYCFVGTGQWEDAFKLDEKNAKFGKQSLKLHYTYVQQIAEPPEPVKGGEYVFSVWLKADLAEGHDDARVLIREMLSDCINTDVRVTSEWQRFEFSFEVKRKIHKFNFMVAGANSWIRSLWVDGMQLEEGEKATEFEE